MNIYLATIYCVTIVLLCCLYSVTALHILIYIKSNVHVLILMIYIIILQIAIYMKLYYQ